MTATRTYIKVARAEAEERTRQALIAAAEDAVLSGSWTGASLEVIADRAGVTKQTLLRQFGSKNGLLAHAFTQTAEEIRSQRFAAPTDDVAGAVDNLLAHYEEYGERAIKVGGLEGDGLGEIAGQARRMHYEWVEHAFGAWLGRERGRERTRLRAALIAVCDLQTWWILANDLGLDRRDVRATLIMTIDRLLGEKEEG
jgi:AcrR family transcriptional regulator